MILAEVSDASLLKSKSVVCSLTGFTTEKKLTVAFISGNKRIRILSWVSQVVFSIFSHRHIWH